MTHDTRSVFPEPSRFSFRYGEHDVTLETGAIARQASGAVMVTMGETILLVTVVLGRVREGLDFLPLTVEYREKFYAGGRIPGGFFKREGRPTERETLTSRLIDRPIRPLLHEDLRNEVQIIATVMSMDPEVDPSIPALIGASAALRLSGAPFKGPIAAARVGYIDGQYVLNPPTSAMPESLLDLTVAGTAAAVLMVESQAALLSEDEMLGAVLFGHRQMQVAIEAIEELCSTAGRREFAWSPPEPPALLAGAVRRLSSEGLATAYCVSDKAQRRQAIDRLREEAIASLVREESPEGWTRAQVKTEFEALSYRVMRSTVLKTRVRIDGRDPNTVRPINVKVGVLPRAHGSAIFTRGETQAIVTTTLGTGRDAQIVDAIEGESKDPFLFHYNFPPFCVGEAGPMIGPKRREIGHGRLARRGVEAVLPDAEAFPYVIRCVSEITESNGSSSMASVCGASLAMMDAGVPLKSAAAGIAMGLVKEGDAFVVLSDILGDEDHLGDMDFKVAGTATGVSALQMDIKIDGITEEIMRVALAQAREGRIHILGEMAKVLQESRSELSERAPRLLTMKIHPDKIREVIGKGGSVIQALSKETGTQIDIRDDGTITIASASGLAAQDARRRIEQITAEIEPGRIYEGRVAKIMDFGAFVTIAPGKDGLVHVSQISSDRVDNVADHLKEGDPVRVKVLEVDKQGRVRLSMKAVTEDAETPAC